MRSKAVGLRHDGRLIFRMLKRYLLMDYQILVQSQDIRRLTTEVKYQDVDKVRVQVREL